jgi:hypothetical protein
MKYDPQQNIFCFNLTSRTLTDTATTAARRTTAKKTFILVAIMELQAIELVEVRETIILCE